MISIEQLKEMIYRESGYKIQVHDNDPILTTFYVNLATLGEALRNAGQIQQTTKNMIDSLPGAADKEMKRAGDAAISALSVEVGRVAQQIAGDAAAAENSAAVARAARWAAVCVLVCLVFFGGTGYLLRMAADKVSIAQAAEMVAAANIRADATIAESEKNTSEAVLAARESAGWAGTEEGRLAKKFFDSGSGNAVVNCSSETWEIKTEKAGQKWCVPKSRPLFSWNNEQQYGWKIP